MVDHKVPASADALRAAILERYEQLSKRLQQIARYVLDEPNAVGLETLAVLADRSGVQPSAIVRFAKSFGFEGATQMQRLFRDELLS
ncbi:MAG: MurR/RpiR family transcriptional regulator, partial [Brevundimonas sp.]